MPIANASKPATQLNPTFDINGKSVMMVTQFVAAVPAGVLGASIANIQAEFNKITVAFDMIDAKVLIEAIATLLT